ncbi:MAG: rod shape-determining protein MreC [Firmicutes bacterium]|nr:rod shape-determining protein MreC [Bacillota bacterium]
MQHESGRRISAIILALAVLALIAVIYITVGERDQLTPVEYVVREALRPLQVGLSSITGWIGNIGRTLGNLSTLIHENHALMREIAELRAENVYLGEQRLENLRLRKLLAFQDKIGYRTLAAEVIARGSGGWLNTLTVNKGACDGIEKDMAVVSCEGLLGRVVSVTANTANVLLIIDPRSAVGGVVQRNRCLALVEGDPGSPGMCLVKCLTMEPDLEVGDRVLSSGLGGIYPKGLIIGEITEVIPGEYGMGSRARLEPGADFARLEEILIILDSSSLPDVPEFRREAH